MPSLTFRPGGFQLSRRLDKRGPLQMGVAVSGQQQMMFVSQWDAHVGDVRVDSSANTRVDSSGNTRITN